MSEPDTQTLTTLRALVAADSEPTLTTEELTTLAQRSRRVDSDGRLINDPEYVPTYDLNYAAWQGWLLKAAKASSKFDIAGDGTTLQRSQVAAACRQQARHFRAQLGGVVQ